MNLIVELAWGKKEVHNNCDFRISTNGVLQIYRGCYKTGSRAAYNTEEWKKVYYK